MSVAMIGTRPTSDGRLSDFLGADSFESCCHVLGSGVAVRPIKGEVGRGPCPAKQGLWPGGVL